MDQKTGTAGRDKPKSIRKGEKKNVPHPKTQGREDHMGEARRRSEAEPPGKLGQPVTGISEGRKHRTTNHNDDKEESPAKGKETLKPVP